MILKLCRSEIIFPVQYLGCSCLSMSSQISQRWSHFAPGTLLEKTHQLQPANIGELREAHKAFGWMPSCFHLDRRALGHRRGGPERGEQGCRKDKALEQGFTQLLLTLGVGDSVVEGPVLYMRIKAAPRASCSRCPPAPPPSADPNSLSPL